MGSYAETETDELCESRSSALRASTDMTSVPKRCSTGMTAADFPRPEIPPKTSPFRRHVYTSSEAGIIVAPRLKRGNVWRRRLVPADGRGNPREKGGVYESGSTRRGSSG